MLGNLLRLAMLAGTGAGMAAGFRQAMLKLAALFAIGMIVALMFAAAIAYFGLAIYFIVTPQYGPVWGAAAAGALLIVLAVLLAVIGRYAYLQPRRRTAATARTAGLASGLGGPLGAAALGASMGSGAGLDIKGALGRNAITVLLTAFIAGMVMNNRRR
jgi:hypothetical protein